jgi:hypothetical protein
VLLRLEEVEERLTDLRAGHHGNWNNKGTKKQKGRRLCLNELNFVALFLCCSAKSGGEISPKPPVKASWKFIGCRIAIPVSEAKGGNGPVVDWIESHGVFTPLQLA